MVPRAAVHDGLPKQAAGAEQASVSLLPISGAASRNSLAGRVRASRCTLTVRSPQDQTSREGWMGRILTVPPLSEREFSLSSLRGRRGLGRGGPSCLRLALLQAALCPSPQPSPR